MTAATYDCANFLRNSSLTARTNRHHIKCNGFLKLLSESQQNSDHQAKKGVCSHLTLFSPIIHACTVHAHISACMSVCVFENGSGKKLQKVILFLKFSDTIQKMTLKTYFQERSQARQLNTCVQSW